MRTLMIALAAAGLASAGAYAAAFGTNDRIVIDAPDVQKLNLDIGGVRTSELTGKAVYGNGGEKIGEIQDFLLTNGYFYAVLDTANSPIEPHLNVGANDLVVVPWQQLRVVDAATLSERR